MGEDLGLLFPRLNFSVSVPTMSHVNNVNGLMERGEFWVAGDDQRVVRDKTESIRSKRIDGTRLTPVEEIVASSTSRKYF
jgi:hypothetical protein